MNKELEEAIKTVRKFNQENRYRDCGKINNSIDMVLQKLDYYKREYEVSQLQLHLLREETNNQLNNSIPKEVIEKEIEELKDMKIDGEVFTTSVNFAIKTLQGILEGK